MGSPHRFEVERVRKADIATIIAAGSSPGGEVGIAHELGKFVRRVPGQEVQPWVLKRTYSRMVQYRALRVKPENHGRQRRQIAVGPEQNAHRFELLGRDFGARG